MFGHQGTDHFMEQKLPEQYAQMLLFAQKLDGGNTISRYRAIHCAVEKTEQTKQNF